MDWFGGGCCSCGASGGVFGGGCRRWRRVWRQGPATAAHLEEGHRATAALSTWLPRHRAGRRAADALMRLAAALSSGALGRTRAAPAGHVGSGLLVAAVPRICGHRGGAGARLGPECRGLEPSREGARLQAGTPWRTEASSSTANRFLVLLLSLLGSIASRRNMSDGEKQRLTTMAHEVLWSMSSRVMANMWLKLMRNPNVKIPQK